MLSIIFIAICASFSPFSKHKGVNNQTKSSLLASLEPKLLIEIKTFEEYSSFKTKLFYYIEINKFGEYSCFDVKH